MESIFDVIKPIKLLQGSHADTGETGSGCFMNVIAYLNGEPQITDQSPCVCVSIRNIAITINDFLTDDERPRLIPFIQRAMGSTTSDPKILHERIELLDELIGGLSELAGSRKGRCKDIADLSGMWLTQSSDVVPHAEKFVSLAVEAIGQAKDLIDRSVLVDRLIRHMDLICPKADEPTQILIERANRLVSLVGV